MYPFFSIKKALEETPQGNMEQNPRKDKKDDTTVGRSEVMKFVWRTSDGLVAILSLPRTTSLPFGRKSRSADPVKPQSRCRRALHPAASMLTKNLDQ
jgi:hypothetical protein